MEIAYEKRFYIDEQEEGLAWQTLFLFYFPI